MLNTFRKREGIFPQNRGGGNKKLSRLMGVGKMSPFRNRIGQMAGKSQKTLKLSLEESLAAYKRGAELLQLCRGRLDDAQQQVRVLEEGVLQDFSVPGEGAKREDV